MSRIFVALNNFCRIEDNYTAMPPFFESFLTGLRDAGNEVFCYQTKGTSFTTRFTTGIPVEYAKKLIEFNPDLCILFNNNFWDISDIVDCPIIIYDVDSPLEWQLKDKLINNVNRYLFVHNQRKGRDLLHELIAPDERRCRYIPFFSELKSNPDSEQYHNIVFLGTNWTWKGYSFLNQFVESNPSEEDLKKALEMLKLYEKHPLLSADEVYTMLKNCPHQRMDLGDLSRAALEISGMRRIKALSAVSDLGLIIVGNYWNIDAMSFFPELLSCVRNKKVWTKQQNEVFYNSAKIAISTNHIQSQGGFSFRACDIMASNACLVTERAEDLLQLFPNVDIPMFTTPAEAREQCVKLLNNENLRQDIVSAVHERIDAQFRFKNVLDNLEDFTNLRLHCSEQGKLTIYPSESLEIIEDQQIIRKQQRLSPLKHSYYNSKANSPTNYPLSPKDMFINQKEVEKQQGLSPLKRFYYNTIGKHLGYNPYYAFPESYIYLGKVKFIKILTVSPTRKEYYWGFLPLLSYTKGEHPKVNLLLAEKAGALVRKIYSIINEKKHHFFPYNLYHMIKHKKGIKAVQRKWRSGQPIRVCLFVSRISCWMFADLYKYLLNSDKFEPFIVVKPFMSRGLEHMKECMTATYKALIDLGYHPYKGYDEETDTFLDVRNELNPDIVFYTKFWKPHFQDFFYIDRFIDKICFLIDYGFTVADHPKAMNFQLQNDVDIYFYFSQIQKEIATKYMDNKAKNVVISGSPKLDRLFSNDYLPKDNWKPQNKPKKRIIWAPHHEDRTTPPMYQFDAFYDLYEVMFEIAEIYRDEIQIAFRPHPLLKVKLTRYWGEEAMKDYYKRWETLENGELSEGDFVDLFLTSDAMILDSISFIAEYSATGKPALFTIGSHTRAKFNKLGEGLYDLMYHAEKDSLKSNICSFIENVVIGGNDPLKERRKSFVQSNILPPGGQTASKNVYDEICSFIENGKILS